MFSLPQPFDRGIEQDLLQRAAMDRELRPFVTGLDAARLAPDRLAVLGEIRQFPGADAGRIELVVQAELDQFAHRMRQHVDADAERPQLGHAFEHFGGNADLVQAERQRQPADAAAGDEYGHVTPLLLHGRHDMGGGRGQLRNGAYSGVARPFAEHGAAERIRAARIALPSTDGSSLTFEVIALLIQWSKLACHGRAKSRIRTVSRPDISAAC